VVVKLIHSIAPRPTARPQRHHRSARAGESGRGCAVVASEVKALPTNARPPRKSPPRSPPCRPHQRPSLDRRHHRNHCADERDHLSLSTPIDHRAIHSGNRPNIQSVRPDRTDQRPHRRRHHPRGHRLPPGRALKRADSQPSARARAVDDSGQGPRRLSWLTASSDSLDRIA